LTRLALAAFAILGWTFASAPAALCAGTTDALTVTITPKDIWPPAPVFDLKASSGAEGQMLLEWTAPDSNNDEFAEKSAAAGYTIRIATFSADSVGSTTTWWNAAQDVAGEPAPATPGNPQSLLLNNLEPGATYYAAIISSDSAGNVSPMDTKTATPGQQAFALVYDARPPAPANLQAFAVDSSSIRLTWDPVDAADLDYYRIYVDSTTPYDFTDASVIAVDSPTPTYLHLDLGPGVYYYYATAVDKGAPNYRGHALESLPSDVSSATLVALLQPPQEPFGVDITTSGTSVTLTWYPTQRYHNRTPFLDPDHPQPDELTGYQIFRATAPTQAPWTLVATLSSNTYTWTDNASGPEYYYAVRAANNSTLSPLSLVRGQDSRHAWYIAPDQASSLEIEAQWFQKLLGTGGSPQDAYAILLSTEPADPANRSLKTVVFNPLRGGFTEDPKLSLDGMALLRMHYDYNGTSVVAAGLSAAAVAPRPENLSVFWWNGLKWLQLHGKLDTVDRIMFVQTKYFGRYQLRTAERASSFVFDPAGLTNRFITPNGDGKNDYTVFKFDNPTSAEVTGKIFDSRGRLVAASLPQGPFQDSLMWDGTANGRPVPSGVYIYQIECDGKTVNGTVIVIK